MKKIIIIGLGIVGALIFAGCKLTRAGYETLDYKVVRKQGAFEIREYPTSTLVSTPMSSGNQEGDDSFMRLFRYIGGANEKEAKISMTTPVFMDQDGTNRQMSFVVPKKTATEGAPKAKAEDISITTREGGKFAVFRFSGSFRGENMAVALEKLSQWIASEHLVTVGKPQVASYDPPFIPPFLKRNEVLFRLSSD